MFDYSEGPTGIYSDHRVKTIAWHRHYTRFWKQSCLYCDWAWPLFITGSAANLLGATPEGEPKFFNAITGKNLSFVDGMEIGRKIWNMDRAVMVLQGRHRDMEVHTGYVYNVPTPTPNWEPVYENGKWSYGGESQGIGRTLNKAKFEEWKTKFYEFEGWDPSSGWPKRSTLEELGLKNVADELQAYGKLGT
jgi:aldehyde:ferredoxin oxidoreductase